MVQIAVSVFLQYRLLSTGAYWRVYWRVYWRIGHDKDSSISVSPLQAVYLAPSQGLGPEVLHLQSLI